MQVLRRSPQHVVAAVHRHTVQYSSSTGPRSLATDGLSALEYSMALDSGVETYRDRKTKIVATLGPSSSTASQLRELLVSGLDVARINCAHGDRESYSKLVIALREAADDVRRRGLRAEDDVSRSDVGIAALAFDIKGPEIRIGRFSADVPMGAAGSREVPLRRGDRVLLSTNSALASASSLAAGIYVGYPHLAQSVSHGSRIFIVSRLCARIACIAFLGGIHADDHLCRALRCGT